MAGSYNRLVRHPLKVEIEVRTHYSLQKHSCHRIMVSSLPFHGSNTGSSPVGTTNKNVPHILLLQIAEQYKENATFNRLDCEQTVRQGPPTDNGQFISWL